MIGEVCPGHDICRLQGFFQRFFHLIRMLSGFFPNIGGSDSVTTIVIVLQIRRGGKTFRDSLRTSLELHNRVDLGLVRVDLSEGKVCDEEEDTKSNKNPIVPPRVAP